MVNLLSTSKGPWSHEIKLKKQGNSQNPASFGLLFSLCDEKDNLHNVAAEAVPVSPQ
jgi:hypothetical protein